MTYVISAYKEGGPNDGETYVFGPFDSEYDAYGVIPDHLPADQWQTEVCSLRPVTEAASL